MGFRFKAVFIDLDDTVLDFKRSEKEAVSKTLSEFGVEVTDSVTSLYSLINDAQWKLLEKGRLTREQVLTRRFSLLFDTLGMPPCDPFAVWRSYEKNLSAAAYILPGAVEAVTELKKDYPVYLATNGVSSIQNSRLELSGIKDLFDGIFISQEIGYNKPSAGFFGAMLEKAGVSPGESVMIGDSLTSDITGGINAGMKTVHLMKKPAAYPEGIRPDVTVTEVSGIPGAVRLLEKMITEGL